METLLSDNQVIDRIFDHLDNKTTDTGDIVWQEPVDNYQSQERFSKEIDLLRRLPIPFCPSGALPENGSYIARKAAGIPLLVVRGDDGVVRAFLNSCRHRGMPVAKDGGCAKAFICPYHAWTYELEGGLKHIPGQSGFPDIDPAEKGLVEVSAAEANGLVYVNQQGPIDLSLLEAQPDYFSADQEFFDENTLTDNANWKLIAETSMEGYHIKALHNKSFYPYGLDNVNIVETFGQNSRITFPFRRIDKLRDKPPEQRRIDGMVTYVYQLFPNTHISVLSNHSTLVVLEPISPTKTQYIIYRMTNKSTQNGMSTVEAAKRDASFVKDSGFQEDRDAACGIQDSLSTNANTHLTFGKFEKAIVHFHQGLKDAIQSA